MTETTETTVLDRTDHKSIAVHPKLPGVEVYLVEIDTDMAREMLDLNTSGQRNLSLINVEKLATDMATFEWIFNGAPLLFGTDGKLYDGQHRLSAIIEADEAQVLLVVTGIDPQAMDTIDTNRRRSYADSLKIKGVSNHVTVAALAGRAWYWFHGNYGQRNIARKANAKYVTATPSNAQKNFWMDLIETRYEITFEHAASFGLSAARKRPGINAGIYALGWVILSGIDKDYREKFFLEVLEESAQSASGYPIVALTNRLGRLKGREKLSDVDQLDLLFSAYNAWMKGVSIKTYMPPRPVSFQTVEIPDGFTEVEISN